MWWLGCSTVGFKAKAASGKRLGGSDRAASLEQHVSGQAGHSAVLLSVPELQAAVFVPDKLHRPAELDSFLEMF